MKLTFYASDDDTTFSLGEELYKTSLKMGVNYEERVRYIDYCRLLFDGLSSNSSNPLFSSPRWARVPRSILSTLAQTAISANASGIAASRCLRSVAFRIREIAMEIHEFMIRGWGDSFQVGLCAKIDKSVHALETVRVGV